jgi:signal peptidase II
MGLLSRSGRRIAVIALLVFCLDQFTKYFVLQFLGKGEERVIIDGFFKFVHWGNTGAAWSLFRGNNAMLAVIALVALLVLFLSRHHFFDAKSRLGQSAFGMLVGGIAGNVTDRLLPSRLEVIDFIYFYLNTRRGEIGFPAFNIADSAICIGVALIFWSTWKSEHAAKLEETKSESAKAEETKVERQN